MVTRRRQITNRNGRRLSTAMKTTTSTHLTAWRDLSLLVSVRIDASCLLGDDPCRTAARRRRHGDRISSTAAVASKSRVFRRWLSKSTGGGKIRRICSRVVFDCRRRWVEVGMRYSRHSRRGDSQERSQDVRFVTTSFTELRDLQLHTIVIP